MLFDIVHRQRLAVLVGVILIVTTAALGLADLRVSTDNRIFYGPNNPHFLEYLKFEDEFGTNDNLLFVIDGPFEVDSAEFPEAIRWITSKVAGIPHVTRVDSLANYPHPTTDGSDLRVDSILDWACDDSGRCQRDLSGTLSKPQLVGRLISHDRTTTGVVATLSIDRGSIGEIERVHDSSLALAEEFEARFESLDVYVTGGVPMMAAFASETAKDLGLLLPVALGLISILLVLVLGSLSLGAVVLAIGVASIVVTLGIAGWFGHILNNATSIVPLVVFTLVVAACMHVAVHFSRNLPAGAGRREAIAQARASLSSSLSPILLSAATSAVSLSSLWFVDSPPIRSLGLLSALGVIVGCLLSLTVLPIALTWIRRTSETRLSSTIQSAVNAYARRVETRRATPVLAGIFFALCVAGLFRLEIDEDFVKFFDPSVPFRVQTDKATELLAGPNHIEVVVTTSEGSVFEPKFLRYLSDVASTLRDHRLVANVHSFSDVMSDVARAFSEQRLGDIETESELAQLFLVYELSLQQGQSNTDFVNSGQTSARISVLLTDSTSSEIQQLESFIYDFHKIHGSEFGLIVTGENIPVAHLSWMNIQSMASGIFISLAFTSIVAGLVFASFRFGVVALAATVIPVLAGFGLWGWINGNIGLAATAVMALTIGVVVDDAAHYVYRFIDARRRLDPDPWASAAYACHRAGTAIVSTSIVMGFGLSLLLASNFEVNSSFGSVACLIIAAALAFDLAVLPRLAVWAAQTRQTYHVPGDGS